ncbi:MAG: FTR1 family iron permease [Rickettsiales bacterium]
MFFSAFVIFREIFEIVLILGIIIAVTNNMPNRKKAIILGFLFGLISSVIFAFFASKITDLANGLGQEITNAIILFTASFFIGWTILWMQKHAKEIKQNFQKISSEISQGKKSYIILAFIIALTILREGAEIILFTYGMLASGQTVFTIALGSLIGFVAGITIGLLMYFSLVKIPLKYFFTITTIMLTLLVAGMFAHAIGYLTAAGYLNQFSNIVWNSSHIISNNSLLGSFLEVTIGYKASPNLAQLTSYIAIITGFFCYFNKSKINIFLKKRLFLAK